MTRSLAALRKEFPLATNRTYLASHSLGATPRASAADLALYHEEWSTLGIEAWDGPWWDAIVDFGALVGRILHAPAGTICPMPNATRAMAGVMSCFDPRAGRDKVVLTDLEFTTTYPLWRNYERVGARLTIVRSDDGITVPAERIAKEIDDETLFVHTGHVYFRSGAVQDIAPIVEAAHEHGALALIDGYQAAGTVPVDVQALGVDFYVGGSHKWLCGGPGAGYLYVRKGLVAGMRPALTGWFGLADPFAYARDLGPGEPHHTVLRFLDGTANVPGMYAARAGVRAVADLGAKAIRDHASRLTQEIIDHAKERGMTVRTPEEPGARSGMVCLDFKGADKVPAALSKENVVCDYRADCGLRASAHMYNDASDVATFVRALDAARR